MVIKITDDKGEEIHLVTVNVICPAKHIADARQIASEHQRVIARVKEWQAEKCLTIQLSPTGQLPATHYLCSMQVHTPQVREMADWSAGKIAWRADGPRELTDNLLDEFLVCVAPRDEFLKAAGLQVIE